MGGILGIVVVLAILIILPIALFFGLVGLTMFLWCWRRVGPYIVNFGRWMGDWRNLLPCGCMVFVNLILVLVVAPLFLPSVFRTLGLLVLVIIMVICGTFAMIVLTVRGMRYFWGSYRRRFWRWMNSLWDLVWRRLPETIERRPADSRGGGRKATIKPPARKQPSARRSGLGAFWALMLGRPAKSIRVEPVPGSGPEPGTTPPKKRVPVKRSMLGNFWALMLGKPSKPAKAKPRPVKVQTTEQTLDPSGSLAGTARTEAGISETALSTAPRARKRAPGKRSWFGALWALMLGKPSKSGQPEPGPAGAKTSEQATRPLETAAAAATAKIGATARVAEGATTPERAKREKPAKRGFFAGIWGSIISGVTFVVGLVFLGVVWVVQKIREGIEWIRVRLNID
jgi:hypothetical protein